MGDYRSNPVSGQTFHGYYNLSNGTLTAGTIMLNGYGASYGTFNQTGGTLQAGTFNQNGGVVTGTLQNNGAFVYNSGNFNGRLMNNGTLTFNADFTAGNGMENISSSPVAIAAGRRVTLNGAGLDNNGTFSLAGGILNASQITNHALFHFGSGSLNVNEFQNEGQFQGAGVINPQTAGSVAFTNSGSLAPGNSPGTLIINGTYVQDADGTLLIELGGYTQGESYDFLAVNGMASLDGTLTGSFWDGFIPTPGSTFDILHASGGLTGMFSDVTSPGGWIFDVAYLDTDSNLLNDTVRLTANPVPIPSAAWLLGSGLFGLVGIRRRMGS